MADQKKITLYSGHATPKTIVLRALPVADSIPLRKIVLWPGHATPKTIILRDPSFVGGGGGPVSADLTITFGDLTITADASVPPSLVTGDATLTFDALTLTGDADVLVTAAAVLTLADLTLTGDADVAVTATAAMTLDDLTLTGDADVLVSGTATLTLDDITLSGAAAVPVTATATITLDDLTLSGAGAVVLTTAKTLRHLLSPLWQWPFVDRARRLPQPYVMTFLQMIVDAVNGFEQGAYRIVEIGHFRVVIGAGSPNGAVLGNPSDIYLNTSGGAGTTFWVKEGGNNTTVGWVGK